MHSYHRGSLPGNMTNGCAERQGAIAPAAGGHGCAPLVPARPPLLAGALAPPVDADGPLGPGGAGAFAAAPPLDAPPPPVAPPQALSPSPPGGAPLGGAPGTTGLGPRLAGAVTAVGRAGGTVGGSKVGSGVGGRVGSTAVIAATGVLWSATVGTGRVGELMGTGEGGGATTTVLGTAVGVGEGAGSANSTAWRSKRAGAAVSVGSGSVLGSPPGAAVGAAAVGCGASGPGVDIALPAGAAGGRWLSLLGSSSGLSGGTGDGVARTVGEGSGAMDRGPAGASRRKSAGRVVPRVRGRLRAVAPSPLASARTTTASASSCSWIREAVAGGAVRPATVAARSVAQAVISTWRGAPAPHKIRRSPSASAGSTTVVAAPSRYGWLLPGIAPTQLPAPGSWPVARPAPSTTAQPPAPATRTPSARPADSGRGKVGPRLLLAWLSAPRGTSWVRPPPVSQAGAS